MGMLLSVCEYKFGVRDEREEITDIYLVELDLNVKKSQLSIKQIGLEYFATSQPLNSGNLKFHFKLDDMNHYKLDCLELLSLYEGANAKPSSGVGALFCNKTCNTESNYC